MARRRILARAVPALASSGRKIQRFLVKGFVKLRFRRVVFPPDRLADGLRRAAESSLVVANLEAVIAANLEAHGRAVIEAALGQALGRLAGPKHLAARTLLFSAALQALARESLPAAVAFGEAWVASAGRGSAIRVLTGLQERAGAILRPLELLASIEGAERTSPARARLAMQARLLANGIPASGIPAPTAAPRALAAHPRRILYYANQSLPHHSAGYSIRTHWLVRHLRDRGWDISVYTRHGYPLDRYDFREIKGVPSSAEVDGIRYVFSPDRIRGQKLDIEEYQAEAVATLVRQAEELRPAVIHCVSNYACGLAGTEAARRLGIPSIYEVRGLWHMSTAAKRPEYLQSDHYRMIEHLEAQAARNADRVFAITQAVKDVLVERGAPADKITVLPNAVDIDAFALRPRSPELAARWRIDGRPVIGYVGTFNDYEGLDYLLEASARLRRQVGDAFRLLLVGDGGVYGKLTELARKLQLDDIVSFTGRQPHATIQDYYSLIDVMAFPRKGLPVCEAVSPLKPFEAMAMAKAVVVSDVRALAEIVEHEVTGLVHRKDDVDSLCEALARCVTQPALRRQLAESGYGWTRENRSWSKVSGAVEAVYRDLTA